MQEKEVYISDSFKEKLSNSEKNHVHIIMIATKPDIVKQAPLYLELKKRKELVLLVHTGQHYDYNLSKGVLEEFGMQVDVNLNIFGSIHKKYSLIVERFGDLLIDISENYNKIPVPYVHGDTLTAATSDKASFLNKFAVVHVEAGIRTFSPKAEIFEKVFKNYEEGKFDFDEYLELMKDKSNYERNSIEPYPEQFCTRSIEASTGFYAVPVPLYMETLAQEGFSSDRMVVTGNTVVDAVRISEKKVSESKAFEVYPNMKGKKFIFVTIHRRENTENKERFLALYYALKKLIKDGIAVCFLGLHASESAIDRYGLREDIEKLKKDYPENFAYGPALAHHHEVIDMLKNAGALVTDSGSMQEESNILGLPTVTLRFGSDRSETLFEGCNVIAPPVNSCLIADIVKGTIDNPKMKKPNLYGENVSEKIASNVLKILEKDGKLFRFDDERMGLGKYINYEI